MYKVFFVRGCRSVWSGGCHLITSSSVNVQSAHGPSFAGIVFHFPRSAYKVFFLVQTVQILNLEIKLTFFLFVCLLRRLQCFKRKKGTDPSPKLNCFNGTTLRIRGFSPRAPWDALFFSCQYVILLDNISKEK